MHTLSSSRGPAPGATLCCLMADTTNSWDPASQASCRSLGPSQFRTRDRVEKLLPGDCYWTA